MLIKLKRDNEKIVMGFLSYLPEFRNIANLQEEMRLNQEEDNFEIYLYQDLDEVVSACVAVQVGQDFVVIRNISLAPGFRTEQQIEKIIQDLHGLFGKKQLMVLPDLIQLVPLLEKINHG